MKLKMSFAYMFYILLLHIIVSCFAEDYVHYTNVDMFYKFVHTPKKWHDAYSHCKSENASLAMPNDSQEATILRDLFAQYPESLFRQVPQPHYVLLGFHDQFLEGDYITLKGEHIQSKYHSWSTNEPKHHVSENCGAMHRFGGLCDYPCAKIAPFICEKNGLARSIPIRNANEGYKSNDELKMSYKLHLRLRTFGEAQTICQSEGADLAVIRSKNEELFLIGMLNDPQNHVPYLKPPREYFAYLGVHDMFREGNFITVQDEEICNFSYVNWGHKEPNGKTGQNCVAISPHDGMCDVPCSKKYMFFCEKEDESSSLLDVRLAP